MTKTTSERDSQSPERRAPLGANSQPTIGPALEASPFQDWFGTNPTPSTEDRQRIRSLIEPHLTELRAIDSKIQDLQSRIALLEEQKAPITKFVAEHERLMNPVHHLPPEILQEIFVRTLLPPSTSVSGSMHPGDCPTILTMVSKRWRDIALNTPRLWSTLHISLPPAGFQDERGLCRARASGLSLWLSRSGSVPLSFSVVQTFGSQAFIPGVHDIDPSDPLDGIFSLLRAHAHRWRRIYLALPLESMMPFLTIGEADIPILTSVAVRPPCPIYIDHTDPTQPKPFQQFISSAILRTPNLTELSLSGITNSSGSGFLAYPICWENLTVLIVDGGSSFVHTGVLLRVLDRAKLLQHLRLEIGCVGEGSAIVSESVVTLPHLKKLGVHEFGPFNTQPFGSAIRCPLLEELEYYEHIPHDFPDTLVKPGVSLFSILSHSGSHIKRLTVSPALYHLADFMRNLRNCPQLQALIFAASNFQYLPKADTPRTINIEFLQGFITPDPLHGGEVLCPKLSTIFCNRQVDFDLGQFIDFLRVKQSGKLDGVARLGRVLLRFDCVEPAGLYDEAASLVLGGRDNMFLEFLRNGVVASINDGFWMCQTQAIWNTMPVSISTEDTAASVF